MADYDDPELGALFANFAKKTTKLGAKRAEETRQRRLAIGAAFDRLVEGLDDAALLEWFRELEGAASGRELAKIQAHPDRPASLPKAQPTRRGPKPLAPRAQEGQ